MIEFCKNFFDRKRREPPLITGLDLWRVERGKGPFMVADFLNFLRRVRNTFVIFFDNLHFNLRRVLS